MIVDGGGGGGGVEIIEEICEFFVSLSSQLSLNQKRNLISAF